MLELLSIIVLAIIVIGVLIKEYIREKKSNSKANNELNNIEQTNTKQYKNKEIVNNKNSENKKSTIDEFCNKHYKKIWIVFAIILFITVIYKFGEIPTYMSVDEAGMAYDAYCLAEYGTDRYGNSYPLYLTNFGGGQSALNGYLIAFFIKIFGPSMIIYRLPTLLIYLMSVIVSYLLISKAKNKKTALLLTFFIITCPWNIYNARTAMDCNLYAGLFMLTLYLMDKAKKNYQYILAGISAGVTLYTYCLSWISMPIFLAVWAIYMLYIKKIKIRQLILFAIPIAILAAPLIYFILLNYGIVEQTQFGIFTLPVLSEFRVNEIGLSNWVATSLESLKTIFSSSNTIYLVYVPLFLFGYILEWKQCIKEIKNKEYGISTVMVIAFTTILIGLLTTRIPTANKANVLYIPILYFVTIGILKIVQESKAILITFIIMISVLCAQYTYYYYTSIGLNISDWYQNDGLAEITRTIENDEEAKEMKKYILVYTNGPDIYTILELKLSPEEFAKDIEYKYYYGTLKRTAKVRNYNYLYTDKEVLNIDLNKDDYIFIVSNEYTYTIDYLLENGYTATDYKYYKILTKGEVLEIE